MKPGDGAAGDCDETKRKDLARKDGPVAVDETRERRQLQIGSDKDDPDRQHEHDAKLYERAEIIARREQ